MRRILWGTLFLLFPFLSCNILNAKFTTKNQYTGKQKVGDLLLIVISDKDTKTSLNYYKNFLVDSLKDFGIHTTGIFHCCRDKITDINEVVNSYLKSQDNSFKRNILTITISKTIIGHGTTSSREFELQLFDRVEQEITWSGTLKANFDWFISDENYRNVAKKLTTATLMELRNKVIF